MTTFFIGDVALDEYYTADRWPGRADKGFVRELPAETGGSIANAAVVYAALGGRAEFVSLLNTSPLSQRLIADLHANGVGCAHMLRDPSIPESRNLIFLVEGEHIVLTVEMGQQPMWLSAAAMAALRQPGYLYTTLYRARRLHHDAGGQTLSREGLLADLRHHHRRAIFDLDVGGCAEDDLPFLQGAAVVIFNQIGFQATFGHEDLSRIGPWMKTAGIGCVVRTLAAEGAEALADGQIHSVPGYTVDVADVTGAGDTFGAALTFGLGQGKLLTEVLEFAVAAASRSVTIHGPRGGKATVAEVLAWRKGVGTGALRG